MKDKQRDKKNSEDSRQSESPQTLVQHKDNLPRIPLMIKKKKKYMGNDRKNIKEETEK